MGNLRAAEEWPDWVDDDRWGLGPDPADTEWAANQNETWDAEGVPDPDDPIWDRWAEESATQDMLERGLSPF